MIVKPAYLFDASSIIRALKEARLLPLRNQAIQWLTIYEVLNALWKEVNLLRILESNMKDLLPLLEQMVQAGNKPLLIIAEDV
jgi:predicted nucleic acid-binding protein